MNFTCSAPPLPLLTLVVGPHAKPHHRWLVSLGVSPFPSTRRPLKFTAQAFPSQQAEHPAGD